MTYRYSILILQELLSIDKVLKEPQPEIGIEQFGETNLLISVRPYVLPDDYWTVYYEAMSRIKNLYFENDIKIAFQEGMELGKVGK